MKEDAPQRDYSLREVFNGLRWLVRTSSPWRYLPNDLSPWPTVYQQAMRWHEAGCFVDLVTDLRPLLRKAAGRNEEPSAAIIDGRTLQSTPESGGRAGYDGCKRKKGSKIHIAYSILMLAQIDKLLNNSQHLLESVKHFGMNFFIQRSHSARCSDSSMQSN